MNISEPSIHVFQHNGENRICVGLDEHAPNYKFDQAVSNPTEIAAILDKKIGEYDFVAYIKYQGRFQFYRCTLEVGDDGEIKLIIYAYKKNCCSISEMFVDGSIERPFCINIEGADFHIYRTIVEAVASIADELNEMLSNELDNYNNVIAKMCKAKTLIEKFRKSKPTITYFAKDFPTSESIVDDWWNSLTLAEKVSKANG